jgi:hypothetical protein
MFVKTGGSCAVRLSVVFQTIYLYRGPESELTKKKKWLDFDVGPVAGYTFQAYFFCRVYNRYALKMLDAVRQTHRI